MESSDVMEKESGLRAERWTAVRGVYLSFGGQTPEAEAGGGEHL